MSKPVKLSQSTIEELQYYVYALVDPDTKAPFYIGKGKGSRINQHLFDAQNKELDETKKLEKIQQIESRGKEVETYVIRHGLETPEDAFRIEDALIDILKIGDLSSLTNIVDGHDPDDRGIMTLQEIELKYQAKPAIFKENVLLININGKFKPQMTENDIYEATRSAWKLSKINVKKIKLVCATYKGIIRGVFIPEEWHLHPERNRLYFIGKPAPKELQRKYLYKTTKQYIKKGNQNPVKYIFPSEGKIINAKGNEAN